MELPTSDIMHLIADYEDLFEKYLGKVGHRLLRAVRARKEWLAEQKVQAKKE
jgi:hypothetical protein